MITVETYYKDREDLKKAGGHVLIFTKLGVNFKHWGILLISGATLLFFFALGYGSYLEYKEDPHALLYFFKYEFFAIGWMLFVIILRGIFAPGWNEYNRCG